MQILLAEDHQPFRDALAALLRSSATITSLIEAADGTQAVELAQAHAPDVVLMDIKMPGMDGIAATRQIIRAREHVKVLVLTTFNEHHYVEAAMQAGASGYLLKAMPPDDLLSAIAFVHRGYGMFSPGVAPTRRDTDSARLTAFRQNYALLSHREREVFEFLAEGRTNDEIAAALYLALGTIKNVVSKVLDIMNVRNRTEAALLRMNANDWLLSDID